MVVALGLGHRFERKAPLVSTLFTTGPGWKRSLCYTVRANVPTFYLESTEGQVIFGGGEWGGVLNNCQANVNRSNFLNVCCNLVSVPVRVVCLCRTWGPSA